MAGIPRTVAGKAALRGLPKPCQSVTISGLEMYGVEEACRSPVIALPYL
jgi:hypothetical protein